MIILQSAKFILVSLLLSCFFVLSASPAIAGPTGTTTCPDRYATIVNPVRSRELWKDHSLKPFTDQSAALNHFSLPATWLIQYDVLLDPQLVDQINNLPSSNEKSIFLEISKKLADDAGVIYPVNTPWYKPNAVFLSGYSQSDRKKLIDTLFTKFKKTFGHHPGAVGAWWIDSYSLNYLKEKYSLKAAMIVADQKMTDNYSVWGQWWGAPYYPSKANILTPASTQSDKQDIVITQWALRDPSKADGAGAGFSNYSLQPNDYTTQGENTSYFKSLSSAYLDCANKIGQITVGLETGSNPAHHAEYQNQLEYLAGTKNLNKITLIAFAKEYSRIYPGLSGSFTIKHADTTFSMDREKFLNYKTNQEIYYSPQISFSDYFIPDRSTTLKRILPDRTNQKSPDSLWYLFFSTAVILFIISLRYKLLAVFFASALFSTSAFGPIFKSYYQFGWSVFFGPAVPLLPLAKCILLITSFLLLVVISKSKFRDKKILLYSSSLTFAADAILEILKFSYISGKYYIGFLVHAFTFVGITFSKPFHLELIKTDLPSYVAGALLSFNFSKIWDNLLFSLVLYPLIHIAAGFLLYLILSKSPAKLRAVFIAILAAILALHLFLIYNSDPMTVLPIL